ncbi:hypothetical protein CAPTEDRAFT_210814 [Capitella teleta]|uniref:Uncharacterized protein n=1 Tax=Capitella teleta TaxID=283909 RepID=R7U854_CAPTE|nr:hypothetical protein CAPTEDRAFT_210814 [Capitella teleta]|eukprot:ELT99831.1 hypothetical protein CAPTEDRAFT_210814 [Capitella teleta]
MATWKGKILTNCKKGELIKIIMENTGNKDHSQTQITELQDEIRELKGHMVELLNKVDTLLNQQCPPSQIPHPSTAASDTTQAMAPSFADVVKETLKSTLNEEKARSDVIISKVEEKDKDSEFMSPLPVNMRHGPLEHATTMPRRTQKSQLTYKLNEEAKKSGDHHSFSLRGNGETWKFINRDGK